MFAIVPKTVTITRLVIELSEDQAREILVDPEPFQAQLRRALGERVRASGNGKHNLALTRKTRLGRPPKSAKASGGGSAAQAETFKCDLCKAPTMFMTAKALGVHKGRMHPKHHAVVAPAPEQES